MLSPLSAEHSRTGTWAHRIMGIAANGRAQYSKRWLENQQPKIGLTQGEIDDLLREQEKANAEIEQAVPETTQRSKASMPSEVDDQGL